jgi:hypothetical protein
VLLSVSAPFVLSQTEDPFSIRVESNLVLVHAEVYDKDRMHEYTNAFTRCRTANNIMFYQLSPSEPYFPKSCIEFAVKGLGANDFHVFEDGMEQKIESVRMERTTHQTARDSIGFNNEWSYTPRGKWSTVDWYTPRRKLGLENLPQPGVIWYFYEIAYVPKIPEQGKCHQIRVTVDRPHAVVFASDQYCYIEHPATDPLNGTKFGKQMENDLDSDKRGKIPLSLQASFFYIGTQTARVDVVLGFPWEDLRHEWIHLDFRAAIGILGVVYGRHGNLAARFSDLACCASEDPEYLLSTNPDLYSYPDAYDFRSRWDSAILPSRYETQIDLPTGEEYDFRVVLSDGRKFGRASTRLRIDSYDGKQLAISSVALCKRFRDAGAAAQEAAAANLAPRYVPLVSRGMQVTPSADTNFKRGEPLIAYYEVYEPLLSQQPTTAVQVHMRIVDAKTGVKKVDFPALDAAPYMRQGTTMIPIGDELMIGQLPKGNYRLEVQATDSAGRSTPWRTTSFTLE